MSNVAGVNPLLINWNTGTKILIICSFTDGKTNNSKYQIKFTGKNYRKNADKK